MVTLAPSLLPILLLKMYCLVSTFLFAFGPLSQAIALFLRTTRSTLTLTPTTEGRPDEDGLPLRTPFLRPGGSRAASRVRGRLSRCPYLPIREPRYPAPGAVHPPNGISSATHNKTGAPWDSDPVRRYRSLGRVFPLSDVTRFSPKRRHNNFSMLGDQLTSLRFLEGVPRVQAVTAPVLQLASSDRSRPIFR